MTTRRKPRPPPKLWTLCTYPRSRCAVRACQVLGPCGRWGCSRVRVDLLSPACNCWWSCASGSRRTLRGLEFPSIASLSAATTNFSKGGCHSCIPPFRLHQLQQGGVHGPYCCTAGRFLIESRRCKVSRGDWPVGGNGFRLGHGEVIPPVQSCFYPHQKTLSPTELMDAVHLSAEQVRLVGAGAGGGKPVDGC